MNGGTNNAGQGYDVGDVIEVVCQFRSATTELAVDPTTVACTFTPETGSATTYTHGTSSTANAERILDDDDEPWYYFRYTPAAKGRVVYRIQATGVGASADRAEVFVRAA